MGSRGGGETDCFPRSKYASLRAQSATVVDHGRPSSGWGSGVGKPQLGWKTPEPHSGATSAPEERVPTGPGGEGGLNTSSRDSSITVVARAGTESEESGKTGPESANGGAGKTESGRRSEGREEERGLSAEKKRGKRFPAGPGLGPGPGATWGPGSWARRCRGRCRTCRGHRARRRRGTPCRLCCRSRRPAPPPGS